MLMHLLKFRGCFLAFLALASSVSILAQTNAPATNSVPGQPAAPEGIVVLNDVVFGKGGTQDLHADIAYPKNATGPLPAVIHIHGGGWSKGSYKGGPTVHLAQCGYFCASIEYRLSDVAKWPAQIQDCKLAVRWLRANAAKYNVDPNRIAVFGGSAGGHLVACLGTMASVKEYEGDGGYPDVSSAVQAVVDFFGPTDFTNAATYSPAAIKLTEGLFGVPYTQNPNLWKSGSPLYYVAAGDPPMLMVHGSSDTLVPPAQSILFDEALAKAGVPHQLLLVKNAGHTFKPDPGTKIDPPWAAIDKTMLDFLGKYVGPPQKPAPGT